MFTDPNNAPAVETPSSGHATPRVAAPAAPPSGDVPTGGTPVPPSPKGDVRDGRGRFVPRNPGGPGNPFARQVAALRQAVLNAVTPADIQAVMRKLIEVAAAGSMPAARLLLGYAIGKPQPAPDPDRMDAAEWEIYRETSRMFHQSPDFAQQPEPSLSLDFVRGCPPLFTEIHRQKLADVIEHPEKILGPRHSDEFLRKEFERICTTRAAAPPVWVGEWPIPAEPAPPVAAVGHSRGKRRSANGRNGALSSGTGQGTGRSAGR